MKNLRLHRLFALAPLALVLAAPGQTTPPAQAPAGQQQQRALPVTVTPSPAQLGDIAPLSTTPAVFTIRNEGSTPVTVRAAQPSCKCTGISDIVGKTIPPGGSIEMSASLKAPPVPGWKDATVFISFVEGGPPARAGLAGTVVMPIRVDPAYIDALNNVRSGTVKLRSADGKPFRILRAGGKAPELRDFDSERDEPRSEYELAWNLEGLDSAMPLWWTVVTDRADCPLIPLRVRNETTGSRHDMGRFDRQWFIPDSILMPPVMTAGKPIEFEFEMEYYNPRNQNEPKENWSQVLAITSGDPRLAAEFIEVRPTAGDFVEVRARLTPAANAQGPIETQIAVTTATGTGTVTLVGIVTGPKDS